MVYPKSFKFYFLCFVGFKYMLSGLFIESPLTTTTKKLLPPQKKKIEKKKKEKENGISFQMGTCQCLQP